MEAGGSSSLDLLGRTVQAPTHCERVDWHWINRVTAELRAGRCRASWCPYCGPIEASWKARIAAAGGASGAPERFVTLTLAPEGWQPRRQKVRHLRHGLVRDGAAWEMAWTCERTKSGLVHIHGLQKGDYVPQRELQRRWGAIVDIRKIKSARGAGAYAMKEARRVAGYASKEAGIDLESHLDLNGHRLMHFTRGYLGGDTQEAVRRQLVQAEEDSDQWQRRAGKFGCAA